MTLSQQENADPFKQIEFSIHSIFQGDIPEFVISKYPSSKRVREHYTSRLALIDALSKTNRSSNFTTYQDIEIYNHLHLKADNSILVSLTHTNSLAAAAISTSKNISSIGIDIESTSREMKEGILKFFRREDDEVDNVLELWCIKEAAFKAISPLYQQEKRLVLKDIIINDKGEFILDSEQSIKGLYKIEVKEDHYVALAIILKSS